MAIHKATIHPFPAQGRVPLTITSDEDPQIACAYCELPQIALAVAFQLLVLDTSSNDQTLLEELLGAAEIGLSHRDFPEVKQPDGLPDAISEVTKNADGFLVILAYPHQVILLQVKRRQCG